MDELILLSRDEQLRRQSRMAGMLDGLSADMAVIADNATKYYLTGRVFSGWIVMWPDGESRYFVKRPVHLTGKGVTLVRKPEEITGLISAAPRCIAFEMSTLSVNDFKRLSALWPDAKAVDLSPAVRAARSVKTAAEIDLIRLSGEKQERVYRRVPSLFRPGMTDVQFQIEIERALRLEGCLGQFRISGDSMELFMGNILAGDNADSPTPYDFAMGGAGTDPSLPVGADNTVITPGMTVMVDANGNFTGYMTDMTRTFRFGDVPAEATLAHQCSIDICDMIAETARPGTKASTLYEKAADYAREAGFEPYFMGHRQKAGFVGHGVGIEINEAPVIAPRSRDIIEPGNVIALEPKFVIPGVGAVGIENTYLASENGLECLTNAPAEMLPLD